MSDNFTPQDEFDEAKFNKKFIRTSDLIYILEEMHSKLNGQICLRERLENKQYLVPTNQGRLVWIADRFVDIDFEKLKERIPYMKDDDRIMVVEDETHGGQTSIFKLYNTESIPNVIYLGAENANLYPTTAAVRQYVADAVGSAEIEFMKYITSHVEMIEKLVSVVKQQQSDIKTLNDNLVAYATKVQELSQQIEDVNTKTNERIDSLVKSFDSRNVEVDTNLNELSDSLDLINKDTNKRIDSLKKLAQETDDSVKAVDSKADTIDGKVTALDNKVDESYKALDDKINSLHP